MRALLAFVVLLSLASCGRSTGYPPAYEVNFMRACEARSTVPGLCACTWGKIEAEVPADEFAAGHLPGAVNIPLAELEARLAELDPAQEIVAYCRGPYCVLSFEAVAALRARGFQARRLEDGLPEWRAAGLPLEQGVPAPA